MPNTFRTSFSMALAVSLMGVLSIPLSAHQASNKKAPAQATRGKKSQTKPTETKESAPPQENLPGGIQDMLKTLPSETTPSSGTATTTQSTPEQPERTPATGNLPPGIADMLKSMPGGAPAPTTGPSGAGLQARPVDSTGQPITSGSAIKPIAKPQKGKTLGNEDFGAPPADDVREKLAKKAEEQQFATEASWREAVKAARAEIEQARQAKADKEKELAARKKAEEAKPKAEPPPDKNPELTKVEELAGLRPKKQAEPPKSEPKPEVDPVKEAEAKLDKLLRQGRDNKYKETPPETPVNQEKKQ